MGKQSEFVAGLRVTDAETRDAALMVLGGQVNKALVAALGAHGQAAMGLSGGDGLVFRARKKRTAPDLGFVGEIVGVRSALAGRDLEDGRGAGDFESRAGLRRRVLQRQRRRDGGGLRGGVQGGCAGVSHRRSGSERRGRRSDALAELSTRLHALTKDAVITGGMLPKLSACREALLQGVKRVRILPAEVAACAAGSVQHTSVHGTEVMVA